MDEVQITIRLEFTSLSPDQLQQLADNIYDLVAREADHGTLDLWDAELVDYSVDVVRLSLD